MAFENFVHEQSTAENNGLLASTKMLADSQPWPAKPELPKIDLPFANGLPQNDGRYYFASAVGSAVVGSSSYSFAAVGKSMAYGIAGGLVESIADKALDERFGNSLTGYRLFKPSVVEAVGLGIGLTMPMDFKWRAAVIGGSWLLGRVENVVRNDRSTST